MRYFLTFFLVSMIVACSPEISEIGRYPNADGGVDAVAAIRETGATVSTPTEVYIVKRGKAPSGDPVFRADSVDGLNISWMDGRTLLVRADKARIFLQKGSLEIGGIKYNVTIEIFNKINIREPR